MIYSLAARKYEGVRNLEVISVRRRSVVPLLKIMVREPDRTTALKCRSRRIKVVRE